MRKTKAQAASTRQQLLDAAERVFREQGVTRTSLTTVAVAAGVTRGAVYWHFKDKADLFAAMCQRAGSPLDTMHLAGGAPSPDDPLGTVHAVAVATLTRLANDPRTQAVFEVVFHRTELTGALAAVAARHERERSDYQVKVAALLEQAVSVGQLAADTDTALAARLLHALVSGIMRDWVLDQRAYDLAARAPDLVATLLAGLVASPPRRSNPVRPRVRPRANML